jgi:hypothetical protein
MPDSQGGSFMRTSHSTMTSARNLASSMGRESFRASSSVSGYGRESGAGWGLPSGLHSGSGEPWLWQGVGVGVGRVWQCSSSVAVLCTFTHPRLPAAVHFVPHFTASGHVATSHPPTPPGALQHPSTRHAVAEHRG